MRFARGWPKHELHHDMGFSRVGQQMATVPTASTARLKYPSSFYGAVARLLPPRNYGVIYAAAY